MIIYLSESLICLELAAMPFFVLTKTQRKHLGDHVMQEQVPLLPMPYPGRDSNALSYNLYSALMALLCTSGASLSPGSHHY